MVPMVLSLSHLNHNLLSTSMLTDEFEKVIFPKYSHVKVSTMQRHSKKKILTISRLSRISAAIVFGMSGFNQF